MGKTIERGLIAAGVVLVAVLACCAGTAIGKSIYKTRYFSNLPEYVLTGTAQREKSCPLCNHHETNPPCLVDLNTGKVGEIRLYDAHKTISNRISEKTDYGRATGGIAANAATYFSFPDNHYASISIQKNNLYKYSNAAAQQFFYDSCMDLIETLDPNCSLVFADIYDSDGIKLYKLEDAGKGIDIRHYSILINDFREESLRLTMSSSYFTGDGKELDY